MNTYKIYKEGHYFFKQFENLEDAQQYAQNIGQEYNADLAQEQIATIELTLEEKKAQDISFGDNVLFQFLVEEEQNNNAPEISASILAKFSSVKEFLKLGAIKAARYYLSLVVVDQYFDQTRKDKYLAILDSYLNQ